MVRYGQIRRYDVANGEGVRTSIFVTGCTHNCFNCFNGQYQDFNYGEVWTDKTTDMVIGYLQSEHVKGLSILGGEPMQNTEGLIEIIKRIKQEVDKDIWIWSGYTFEEIMQDKSKRELLSLCDILVDGRFIQSLRNLNLKFRGSSNQRIIDIQKSLKKGVPVIFIE